MQLRRPPPPRMHERRDDFALIPNHLFLVFFRDAWIARGLWIEAHMGDS